MLPFGSLRSLILTLAILFASAFAPAFEVACADEACASQECAGHEEEGGPCDECPPDCNAGCVCCAHVSALPTTSAPVGVVLVTQAIVYERRLERAPRAPEPRERDLVPRA